MTNRTHKYPRSASLLGKDDCARSQDSQHRPRSGVHFDLLTYLSIPKRIGGGRDLPAGTSEFDSSTSRVAKVPNLSSVLWGYKESFIVGCFLNTVVFVDLFICRYWRGKLSRGYFSVRVTNFSVVIFTLALFYYDW